ncbi:MAG: hydroxymethylglutaryl-CoA synthase family protein [Candidatus Sedimenticola sp. (ex Thyasira tokunagai)]
MDVGIESINAYVGQACLDVNTLFRARGLDSDRVNNLMMKKKSVGFICEDSITNAVNAAKPLIDSLSQSERERIELVITATESGVDFGKSLSTYVHKYLSLSKNCRLFELKQACYGGTAALQMAAHFMAANPFGGRALVIATDTACTAVRMTYAEPSQGTGAVAMLVSQDPRIMKLEIGASGCYSYEVMDTCRPEPDMETGNADTSLLSYLDCLSGAYKAYKEKVQGVDLINSFNFFSFHTPFAGMVKGAHRKLMRENCELNPSEIEDDFLLRVAPSLIYCAQVGNIYSATTYLALCSLIDSASVQSPKRVGVFSYGSGCSSEFYSGILMPGSGQLLRQHRIDQALTSRYELSMEEYEHLLNLNSQCKFGTKNMHVKISDFESIYRKTFEGSGLLTLRSIDNYYRHYDWS